MNFDRAWALSALSWLESRGVVVEDGLTAKELADVEDAVGSALPADLKILWSTGLAVGESWPRWRTAPEHQAADDREWIRGAFSFDIRNNEFWRQSWGDRPDDPDAAVEAGLRRIAGWPPLVRIYSHRFLPTEPSGPGGPVLSVYQAVDSIVYGADLDDYLSREFGRPPTPGDRPVMRAVPYWGDAFEL